MIQFSANLGFLWPDLPLLERIEAAGKAGFKAVELHWPYDVPPEAVRQACETYGMRLLGINTPLGDVAKGDFGLAAVPGREADFQATFDIALDYARASGATAIHAMAGVPPPEERGQGNVHPQHRAGRRQGGPARHPGAAGGHQPARQAGLLLFDRWRSG